MLQRVDARIKKRRSDLTASRGELIEVNVESAFEPIIQEPKSLISPTLQAELGKVNFVCVRAL
jgi:hypothetical protein